MILQVKGFFPLFTRTNNLPFLNFGSAWLAVKVYIFLYSNFYILCVFGLAASLKFWACGALFCLFAASAGPRCCPARLLGGGGLRGARSSREERPRQNEPRRAGSLRMRGRGAQTARHRASRIFYIYVLLKHIQEVCVSCMYIFVSGRLLFLSTIVFQR